MRENFQHNSTAEPEGAASVCAVCVAHLKSGFIISKLRTDSIICRNHMEISLHCSSWSTKFGSNRIGGIGGPFILEKEQLVVHVFVRACV